MSDNLEQQLAEQRARAEAAEELCGINEYRFIKEKERAEELEGAFEGATDALAIYRGTTAKLETERDGLKAELAKAGEIDAAMRIVLADCGKALNNIGVEFAGPSSNPVNQRDIDRIRAIFERWNIQQWRWEEVLGEQEPLPGRDAPATVSHWLETIASLSARNTKLHGQLDELKFKAFNVALDRDTNWVPKADLERAQAAMGAVRKWLRCEECGEPATHLRSTEGDGNYWFCDDTGVPHGTDFYCYERELFRFDELLGATGGKA